MTEAINIKQRIESDDEEEEEEEEEEGEMDITTEISIEQNNLNIKKEEIKVKRVYKVRNGKNFQQDWFDQFPSWKDWVVRLSNDTKFYCKYCDKTMLCGKKEIRNHEKTLKHIKKKELSEKMIRYGYVVNSIPNVPVLFATNGSGIVSKSEDITESNGPTFKEKLRDAERKITELFFENNIPFMLAPKIIGLFKELEPLVLKDIRLSSSKMSTLAKEMCALKTGHEKIVFPKTRKKQIKIETKH